MPRLRSSLLLLVPGVLAILAGAAISAQDRYTVAVPGGLSFAEFQGYEAWQSFGTFVTTAKPQLGPGIKERIAYAATVTADQAAAAYAAMAAARTHICGLVPAGTVMALPTSPCIAPPVDLPADEIGRAHV